MSGLLLKGQFLHSDAFAESIRGWDLDFQQLDAGRYQVDMQQVGTLAVMLTTCHFSRKIEQRGTAPEGYYTFGLPMFDEVPLRRFGQEVGANRLVIFRPGDRMDVVSGAGFGAYTISISIQRLEGLLNGLEYASIEEWLPREIATLELTPLECEAIRRTAILLNQSTAQNSNLVQSSAVLVDFEARLLECVLTCLQRVGSRGERALASSRNRARALKRSVELIGDRCHEPVSIAELQANSGVSSRTLLYAFQEEYGLSPKAYLQLYRLREAHRDLLRGGASGSTVSDIANRWGFWHMGQFAADYRKLFGVRPSDSLNSRG